MKVLIIGGGILGTAHAIASLDRGHTVVHLERELEARGATVRNFGLVWVSGRSDAELDVSLRSRTRWEELGKAIPDIGFRANGSITLLRTEAEMAVAEQVCSGPTAQARGFSILDRGQVRSENPALRGDFRGGLLCTQDAAVESRVALPAIRRHLAGAGSYEFHPGTEVRTLTTRAGGVVATDDTGRIFEADTSIYCPGSVMSGLTKELAGNLPLRRVRLQMMQTAALGETLTTSIADGDSLRYYPGFAGSALDSMNSTQPQASVAAEHRMQLLCVQRLHGGLTIGDTHAYDEPFAFDVDEAPYDHLASVATELLGRPLPPIVKRWAGIYSQCTEPGKIVHREQVEPGIWVVAGPGGRGMTLGPAIGIDTVNLMGL